MSLLISTTKTTAERRAAKGWSAKSGFGVEIADRTNYNRGNR
jgi:hypothetical protein